MGRWWQPPAAVATSKLPTTCSVLLACWAHGPLASSARQWRENDCSRSRIQLFSKAAELGRKLYHAALEKKKFPEQEAAKLALEAYMKGLVGYMKDSWRDEYDYWQKLGNI